MKQPSIPSSNILVFILSIPYWIYLAFNTQMDISFDALAYHNLGSMLYTQGWLGFFKTGPNREGLYPLMVAASMALEHLTGLAYTKIMALLGVLIMFLTQVLTYKILRLLNIRNSVCILVLGYLALSPALNNSAFSLYSEIATYPFILGIILASFYAWEATKNDKKYQAFFYSMLLGICLMSATLIKGAFEGIAPVYLIIFFAAILLKDKQFITKKFILFTLCLAAALSSFYVPITGYKWLNWRYNGNFVITGRASWMVYGSAVRRTKPLDLKKLEEALAYIPGEGVCNSIFGQKECFYWNFQTTDGFGIAKREELEHQQLSPDKINTILLKSSARQALENPLQYLLFNGIEGLKMFFWESTKVGFVSYPHWLEKIYNIKLFNNALRFLVSLISFIAVLSLWRQALGPRSLPLVFLLAVLILLYIVFLSFVCILDRYALPIAPLYLIAIGLWLN